MRIIAGEYKSRSLPGKLPNGIRPTLDAIRENIFNIINNYFDIEDIVIADICAGSGAVGIEAISRGAKKVYFVDKSRNACSFIQKNLDFLKVPKAKYEILCLDAIKAINIIQDNEDNLDFIFTDPPYYSEFLNSLIEQVAKLELLSEDGVFAVETAKNEVFKIPDALYSFREKVYGDSKISFLELNNS